MEDKKLTPHAQLLFDALIKKGINAQPEYSDGHKHVDIAVLDAKLYIEVDGLNHFTDSEQIMRDFKRSHYSDGDDFSTFYVTNQIIDNYLEEVVNALVKVIGERKGVGNKI
jgi:very-short-patch-repair endonuclease